MPPTISPQHKHSLPSFSRTQPGRNQVGIVVCESIDGADSRTSEFFLLLPLLSRFFLTCPAGRFGGKTHPSFLLGLPSTPSQGFPSSIFSLHPISQTVTLPSFTFPLVQSSSLQTEAFRFMNFHPLCRHIFIYPLYPLLQLHFLTETTPSKAIKKNNH